MIKTEKEKTLKQIKKIAEEAKKDEEEIKSTFKTYDVKKEKILKPFDWIIIMITCLLMIFGVIEKSKTLVLIGGVGFLLLVLKIVYIE